VVLEYLEQAEFKKLTANSPTDAKEILDLLCEVSRRGRGEDREEVMPGLTCFAAPILDLNNQSVAAINISGATQRMTVNEEEKIQRLCESARTISRLIW
jgi:DNA-binding IclR family transcriptional regulator